MTITFYLHAGASPNISHQKLFFCTLCFLPLLIAAVCSQHEEKGKPARACLFAPGKDCGSLCRGLQIIFNESQFKKNKKKQRKGDKLKCAWWHSFKSPACPFFFFNHIYRLNLRVNMCLVLFLAEEHGHPSFSSCHGLISRDRLSVVSYWQKTFGFLRVKWSSVLLFVRQRE